ncbi:Sphingomyelinase D [Paramyrothecium foliicola]|nr:Sphingomyelinase D [Paramyrothecium foliicola]
MKIAQPFFGSVVAAVFFHLPWPIDALTDGEATNFDEIAHVADIDDITCKANTTATPFYAIGHHMLYKSDVIAAFNHGANAIEVDMTPHPEGWYADHGILGFHNNWTRGDTTEDIFRTVVDQRTNLSKPATFVWLDMKKPDLYPEPNHPGSIQNLQKLGRSILQQAGVRVFYGFYGDQVTGNAFRFIAKNLNSNEVIGVDGNASDAEDACFNQGNLKPEDHKCIMSKGCFMLNSFLADIAVFLKQCNYFGDCGSASQDICPQLSLAAQQKKFQKVFGWTISSGNKDEASRLISKANVDGLIYGFPATRYTDSLETRSTFEMIAQLLRDTKGKRCLATAQNSPW